MAHGGRWQEKGAQSLADLLQNLLAAVILRNFRKGFRGYW